ncbi:SH3 domain-containing protein [Aestuariivirga litoralis]|uniref:SH3 domain-containing protein n=1 Tax=Aestuariivirga litoralis TaxID=2650924 RepID=UPI0018C6628A|nr:SH3 domain-containing protein [Aestuariivirga litoralis]MBG1231090.1 SH3 domain-containing protein [Aestuariivirga litoralis]
MKRLGILFGLAVLAGIAGASTAEARTATPTTNVNVRSGPGTDYAVLGVLPAGSRVFVGTCSGSWCSVKLGGLSGWASASYLAATYRPPVVIVRPPILIPRPPHHRPPGWRPGHGHHKPPFPGPKPPMCKIAPGHPCP